MKPGISSYTFTWAIGVPGSMPGNPMSAYDLVEQAKAYGLGLVQIADNLPLETWADKDLIDLKNFASARGVVIEMGGRCLTPEHTMKCLHAAEMLGSSILRMVIDGKDFEPDLEKIIRIVRDLIPEFRKRNIRLAVENHDRFKAREFETIIKATGNEWVGICLDSVNSMGAGEGFETVSDILLPYTINLHLKDFIVKRVSHKMGFVVEGTPAGTGMLNIAQLVSKLEVQGSCSSAILELWTPPADTIEKTILREKKWADESVAFMKTIF